ncbi:hypothetical protein GP486_002849 [Trichoglossum hirsutum]|uniref:IQ calmodulin-binding motif protein n=1 Tax=Trichoglossum hirsutum TaxID=265104 RepID=A0A9P8RRQ2_9PEZI|nr:hypothetical protein GP486_002849 [Trichoglossum hirsutum]
MDSPDNPSVDGIAKHDEYLQKLEVPTTKRMEEIAEKQEKNEERNYRGYRSRRIMKGMGLDASMRWTEAIKEARYRHIIQPMPRRHRGDDPDSSHPASDSEAHKRSSGESGARENWKRVASIARRAGGDDEEDLDEDEEELTEEQRAMKRQKKQEEKAALRKHAKVMDLQYFLEMVDRESPRSTGSCNPTLTFGEVKHRYGSNLRAYHEEWKKADTKENFFYWLDYGEGKHISLSSCPRERLDREQVRYLSREERMNYLVKIDDEGRLCWAKNGVRIDTSEKYKDSIHGIVPMGDTTPAFSPRATVTGDRLDASSTPSSIPPSSSPSSSSSSSPSDSDHSAKRNPYANEELSQAKGLNKVRQVSAATIFNRLLRKTVKRNTWIFDSSAFHRNLLILYSFPFLKLSIKAQVRVINNSGHYRPPPSNFRSFMHMLKASGADVSHVTVSKSYAILIGLEAYAQTQRKFKSALRSAHETKDRLLHPKATAGGREQEKDGSKIPEKERRFLENQKEVEKREKAGQHDEALRGGSASVVKVM